MNKHIVARTSLPDASGPRDCAGRHDEVSVDARGYPVFAQRAMEGTCTLASRNYEMQLVLDITGPRKEETDER